MLDPRQLRSWRAGAILALTAGAGSCTLSGLAAAQEGATLSLVTHLAPDSRFSPERIRRAIGEELAVDVVPDAATAPGGVVTVDEQGGRVAVSFDSPSGRHERREMEPPADVPAAEKDIALLAMNLVRDQTAGFLSTGAPTPDRPASPEPEVVSPPESAGSSAPTAAPRGLELGASTTIGTPIGIVGGADVRRIFSYMASIRADAGYRVRPSLYLGAYFTYGFPSVASSCQSPNPPPPQCAVQDFAAGLGFAYDPHPASRFSWWIGASQAVERLTVHWNGSYRNGGPIGFSGIEFTSGLDVTALFVTRFQIGLDYKPTPTLRLGPFFDSALGLLDLVTIYTHNDPGPYDTSTAPALYLWVQVGIRGSYVLPL